jgi:hypothetical protein
MRPDQDTNRSQAKNKILPLPLEIAYLPTDRKGRARFEIEETGEERVVRLSIKPGGAPAKVSTPEDPWQLRDEFLSLELTPEGLKQAQSRFSFIWLGILEQLGKPGQEVNDSAVDRLVRDELKVWQSLLRAALTTRKDRWPKLAAKFSPAKVGILCRPLPLEVDWREGLPAAIIRCTSALEAMIATVWIDAVLGAEYRFCACRGCTKPQPFKMRRRGQKYCDDDCKHLQVVRNIRKKKRDEALAAKKLANLQGDK